MILAVDKNSSQRKIVMMAMMCRLEDMQRMTSETVKYIWEHDQCTEVRIGLVHYEAESGTMSVDKDMEQVLKGMGFRWICVNNSNEMRITIYALKRPLNTLSIHSHQFYPVIIEHFTSYAVGGQGRRQPTCSYMSILTILKLIMEKKDELTEEVKSNEDLQHFLSELPKIEEFVTKIDLCRCIRD